MEELDHHVTKQAFLGHEDDLARPTTECEVQPPPPVLPTPQRENKTLIVETDESGKEVDAKTSMTRSS